LYSDQEDIPLSTLHRVVDLENGGMLVSGTGHQLGNSGDDAAGRGSSEGFDVNSTALQTPGVQNQIKASSEINVISLGCDLKDRVLQPVKQPVGITR